MQAMARRLPPPVAKTTSIPSPTGGWNARDSYGDMDPRDAVILTNFFPATSDCLLRYGYTRHLTGVTGQAETLMVYASGTATKLFVVNAAGSIFPATTAGAVTASASVTGMGNGRFEYINITTSAASYLAAVNGADKTRYYTGSTWAADGDGAPYDVTGFNTETAAQIHLHKSRIWYIEEDTLSAWYLPTGALGGAATEFDLSAVAMLGGSLIAMATWTIDAGYGMDDLAVWVTSEGECIVYKGTDPASAATWALVGIFHIGSPVGRRCLRKWKGDLLIITQDGVMPLSGALQSSRTNPKVALTDKIQSAMADAVNAYGSNFGWELIDFPKQNQLYLNVPVTTGNGQQQYVMNTITGAWCNFTGWNANCWALFNDNLYFGTNGFVARAWNGNRDNAASILGDGLQAFNYLKQPGKTKRATMIRPVFLSNGTPMVYANVAADFNLGDTTTAVTSTVQNASLWTSALWDSGKWGGSLLPVQNWQSANSIGKALAPRVKVDSNGIITRWMSTDLVTETGGIL